MNNDNWSKAVRLGGLRRFAIAITVLNILGHSFFGFEQAIAQPLVALATAYTLELLFETIEARKDQRKPFYLGGPRNMVDFLLSAHITGLAVAMLTYANDRLWPVVFATAVAMSSKAILRIPVGNGTRHFLNPSNFGITAALLAFPWVGIAPPYHFTENLDRVGDWVLPSVIIVSGTLLNTLLTKKIPLIAAWIGGFALQDTIRSLVFDTPLTAALLPMTGVAFILYTFYMVTDPATTPSRPASQVLFGLSVAATYGLLMTAHIVFGLFFALTIVCAARGAGLYAYALVKQRVRPKFATRVGPQVAAIAKEI
jgi:Na+-translocating ferredoxin:NAD+ oxidoreductase RnfD subunit